MRYLAIGVIVCCVVLNFIMFSRQGEAEESAQIGRHSYTTAHEAGRKAFPEPLLAYARGDAAESAGAADTAKNTSTADEDANSKKADSRTAMKNLRKPEAPDFIRGLYLHNYSARNEKAFNRFLRLAKKYSVNTLVLDMQDAVHFREYKVPAKHVAMCISNNIYPVARVVVFPYGLKRYPVPSAYTQKILQVARHAAEAGFPEVQFDYIRFEDTKRLQHVSRAKRYALVEGFLKQASDMLAKYNVRTSADVFGRVTLNRGDQIGQRLEGLDRVVNFINPMVYPSHFSWSRYMMANPYYTVYKSSIMAKPRLKRAELIMYIQGFVLRAGYSGLSLPVYIAHQMQAAKDAGIRGFIIWNAAQKYAPSFRAFRLFDRKAPLPAFARIKSNKAKADKSTGAHYERLRRRKMQKAGKQDKKSGQNVAVDEKGRSKKKVVAD